MPEVARVIRGPGEVRAPGQAARRDRRPRRGRPSRGRPASGGSRGQSNGIGYYVLTSDGGVHNYGTPTYGSDIGHLPAGVTAAGIAADRATGGYWILKSNGGADAFNAPWYGSLAWHVPAGQSVTGITGE